VQLIATEKQRLPVVLPVASTKDR